MNFWPSAPPPKTALGRYRQLSPLAGVHVSPFCLGGMSVGDKWAAHGMGAQDKESSFKLLDVYYDAGGNFIDTGNSYQDGTSEEFIGEWMEKRNIRDQMVVATKYTASWKRSATDIQQEVHYVGNSVKSMTISLEASLKKLRTHYVDIFYVHWWNWDTSIEEIMNGLHNLVAAGKVLNLGILDCPAWIVPKANLYARMTGKTPSSIYQGLWSGMVRAVAVTSLFSRSLLRRYPSSTVSSLLPSHLFLKIDRYFATPTVASGRRGAAGDKSGPGLCQGDRAR
ncbi:NADP-dependent oxidoreductase domain-containing protein [Cerioporus squamosus]|nr:NADP-dependent oxidoreductase domain-containing protein [Cerioporus squamosus]